MSMEDRLAGLERSVRQRMKEWNVPGCAIGIVRGRGTVYTRGFGLRDIGHGLPVTEKTLFYTASFGKTFTATVAAILVDERKLGWDTPLRDYVPRFRMRDQVATERATLRDFLSQRTGLGRHGRLWVNAQLSRAEVLRRLKYLEPCKDFRSGFEYNNLNYIIAGAVMERVTGETWEELVRSRLLEPLSMKASRFASDDLSGLSDIATGYELEGKRILPFFRSFRKNWSIANLNGPCAPAGAIFSNAGDICRYLRLHLRRGQVGKQAVVSEVGLRETHTPHAPWPGLGDGTELLDASYSMGWVVQPYRGHACLRCGGSGYGFCVHVVLLPEEATGVVVLANQAGTVMAKVIAFNLCDRLLGLPPVSWSKRYLEVVEKQRARAAMGRTRRRPSSAPPRPLGDYTGEYKHSAYGRLSVTREGRRLRLEHNGFPFRMDYDHGDAFTISLPTVYENKASFATGTSGTIDSVGIQFASGVGEIVFRRTSR